MSKYYSLLTDIGKASIANATVLNQKVNFKSLALGDGGGEATEQQTKLKHEVWRGDISSINVHESNPNWVVLETIVPSSVGGFTINEAGLLDDTGNLIAVAKYPETYKPSNDEGAGKDLVVRIILEVSNASVVTLKINPSVVLATKKDIEDAMKSIKVKWKDVQEAPSVFPPAEHTHNDKVSIGNGITSGNDVYNKAQIDQKVQELQAAGITQDQVQNMITPQIILTKIKTVDGQGSGLEADTVRWAGVTGKPSTFTPSTHQHPEYLPVSGKSADSDKLDGVDSSGFMRSYMGNGTLANDLGIAKELRWKNYGQNHTIFDASNSRTPTGRSCNNTNPEQLWSSTFPTLMGWNGSQTYGVRVDSARNADLVAGRNLASEMDSLKSLSVSGKQAHINGINQIINYNSGLTTNNSWQDLLWWWQNKACIDYAVNRLRAVKIRQTITRGGDGFAYINSPLSKTLFMSYKKPVYPGSNFSFETSNVNGLNLNIQIVGEGYGQRATLDEINGNRMKFSAISENQVILDFWLIGF